MIQPTNVKITPSPPNTGFSKEDVLRRSLTFFNGVENRFGFAWRRYCSVSAGPNLGYEIRNPTNNLIAVIEKFYWMLTAAGGPVIYFGNGLQSDLTTVTTPTRLDGRQGSSPSGLITSQQTGAVTVPSNMFSIGTFSTWPANLPFDYVNHVDQEFPIVPGDGILFTNPAAPNLNIIVFWRERLLEEIEKSGNYGKII